LDRIKIEDIAPPQPAPGEVLLRVRSAGLNHLDIWVRKGRKGVVLPMPHILGSDAAGVVEALGPDVGGVKVGDEVILNPGLSCGRCEYCRRGQQSLCASFGIVGLSRPGTFAEFVAIPAKNLRPKPPHLTFDEAGAFVLSFVTAWRMLMTRAQLKPGQTLLIHGIGGGVALSALKLAKLTGAEVIVTSSSDEKLARAKEIGADHTINYKAGDVARSVKEITAGRGVDVVVDTAGAATWPIDFSAVRPGGKIVLCGITTGPEAMTNLRVLYWNQLTIMGSTMGSDEDFRQMVTAVAAVRMKPVMDSVHPLEEVRQAALRMEAANQFGKIVLRICEQT
jgi:NADPH:quinone reductase-like Zn-dependent oxidoreductase